MKITLYFAVFICLLSLNVFADPASTTLQNPDFSITFPAGINYIQKAEKLPAGNNKTTNAYLYVNAKYPNVTNLIPAANETPHDSYMYVVVVPMVKKFNNSTEMIKAQRAFIAYIAGSNQFGLSFQKDEYYNNLIQQMTSLDLNGRTYQTYTLQLPKVTVEYFTFMQNQTMYLVQAFLVNTGTSSLNDAIVKQVLQSITLK